MNIADPGLYDLPMADYLAIDDWWSSSQLKAVLPSYTEPNDEAALRLGTLVHSIVLEPDTVDDLYVALDARKIGVTKDGKPALNPTSTAAWKQAVAEAEESGKTVVSVDEWDTARRMADSVAAHKTAHELFYGDPDGTYEESAFWRDDDGRQYRCRFDRRIPGAIVDLKTTSTLLTEHDLAKTCEAFLYHLSAAHYLAIADGLGLGVDAFAFVFVSKAPPHHTFVVDIDAGFLAVGRDLRDHAIDLKVNGHRGFSTLTLPPYPRHVIPKEQTA